jgi:hypothetical protein
MYVNKMIYGSFCFFLLQTKSLYCNPLKQTNRFISMKKRIVLTIMLDLNH